MLDLLALFATGAFILTGAVVGIRLLRLAHRTRELTDFLVGFSLFVLAAVSYPLTLIVTFADLPLPLAKALSIGSSLAAAVGWACVFLFTQRAFRSSEAWAKAVAWAGVAVNGALVVASVAFAGAASDRATLLESGNPAFWLTATAILLYLWTGFEGFRCWVQARRRLKLGLAEPLVANRFLMWGCVGCFAMLSVAPSFVMALAGGSAATDVVARLTAAVGGLGAAIALQLAFLPPASYRRWVERSAAVAA